jgi:hypothetical protein
VQISVDFRDNSSLVRGAKRAPIAAASCRPTTGDSLDEGFCSVRTLPDADRRDGAFSAG